MNKFILLIFCIIFLVSSSYSQDSTARKKSYSWINLGIGGSSEGISFGLNISLQRKKNIFSIRGTYNENFCILYCPDPNYNIRDLGLLFGQIVRKPNGFASLSAGISYVRYNGRGPLISSNGWFNNKYKELHYSTIGIPIETQLFLTKKEVAMGIYAFANINNANSFGGALFCLQIAIGKP